MSEIDDGGPVFPGTYPAQWGMALNGGLSKRDFFAALIMAGFAADPTTHELFDDMTDAARSAYEGADAMLATRKGGAT